MRDTTAFHAFAKSLATPHQYVKREASGQGFRHSYVEPSTAAGHAQAAAEHRQHAERHAQAATTAQQHARRLDGVSRSAPRSPHAQAKADAAWPSPASRGHHLAYRAHSEAATAHTVAAEAHAAAAAGKPVRPPHEMSRAALTASKAAERM